MSPLFSWSSRFFSTFCIGANSSRYLLVLCFVSFSGIEGVLVYGFKLVRHHSFPCPFTLQTILSGSFHVSLLAGRILLKDFHYHSSNQTFKIVKVQLRWQYWIRSLTHSEDLQAHGGSEGPKGAPTSFSLSLAWSQTQSQLPISPSHRIVASMRTLRASSGLFTIERPLLTTSSRRWKQTYRFRRVARKVLVQIGLRPS